MITRMRYHATRSPRRPHNPIPPYEAGAAAANADATGDDVKGVGVTRIRAMTRTTMKGWREDDDDGDDASDDDDGGDDDVNNDDDASDAVAVKEYAFFFFSLSRSCCIFDCARVMHERGVSVQGV